MRIARTLLSLVFATYTQIVCAEDFPSSFVAKGVQDAKTNIPVNVSKLQPGQLLVVKYADRGVWVYKRTEQDKQNISEASHALFTDPLDEHADKLVKKSYFASSSEVWTRLFLLSSNLNLLPSYRSLNPDYFVVANWSPESGCVLSLVQEKERIPAELTFFDACTGAKFDAAGRGFYRKMTAPGHEYYQTYNLYIPPHKYVDDQLVIGIDADQEIPDLNYSRKDLYGFYFFTFFSDPTAMLMAGLRYNDRPVINTAIFFGADPASTRDIHRAFSMLQYWGAVMRLSQKCTTLVLSQTRTQKEFWR